MGKTKSERRQRTSALAAAGGLANVSVIAAYQRGVFDPDDVDLLEIRHEVVRRSNQIGEGNETHVSGLLMAQMLALNSIFTSLALKAQPDDESVPTRDKETFLRLALKAQSQCRLTLETLMAIGNPPVLFTQQANVAFGPQQVNNGVASSRPTSGVDAGGDAQHGSHKPPQNELLEKDDGERMDTRTPGAAGGGDSSMVPVAAINRAEKHRRQSAIFEERRQGRDSDT